jgi:hypothetical protein
MGVAPIFKRCALLGAILGAHLLLLSRISVNDHSRGVRRLEKAPATLFFVDLPEPDEIQPSTHFFDPSPERTAPRDSPITLPPKIEETNAFIDWDAEASRLAADAARRMSEEEKPFRSLDSRLAGLGPPPPRSSVHRRGDSQHFEGGEIVTWIGKGCYYSNQNMPIAAFGQALRLQIPTCTGAGGDGGKRLPTFEEWKKERDSR